MCSITYSLLCLFYRAVYRRADVYLLDDPLGAVDTVVGRRLFETCLKGVLSSSVVVLVTHQLQYAQLADTMLVVDQVGFSATIYTHILCVTPCCTLLVYSHAFINVSTSRYDYGSHNWKER